MFRLFKKIAKPTRGTKILDVGVASLELFPDSNMFEKLYPYQHNLTGVTIESGKLIKKRYPKMKVVQIDPKKKLPFKRKEFPIAVSWATIEHVGGFRQQENFLNEMLRVSKKIFVTTPFRGCIYEPHSGIFFLHWLPLKVFRKICLKAGKKDWAKESILNPLYARDILSFKLTRPVKVRVYRMFGFLPTHLIITG